MRIIKLEAELTYDDALSHGTDREAERWFYNDILRGEHLTLNDNGELGDSIGEVKVLHITPVDQEAGFSGA